MVAHASFGQVRKETNERLVVGDSSKKSTQTVLPSLIQCNLSMIIYKMLQKT